MKADRSHTSDARNDGDTKMSARIEEWLSRMHETASSGTVRITATERGRDLGWAFEITTATDVGKIADTIDQTCTDAGLTRCELRAFTAEGRWFGQFLHKVDQPAEIVPAHGLIALPAGLEDVVQHTLDATRSFAGLSFKAIVKNQEIAGQMVDRLDKQVAALTKENAELRQRLSERWEAADQFHTHQADDDLAKDKAMRHGRIAETFVNALMARLTGRTTPEGQTIMMRMARAFLRSLTQEQLQKIAEVLMDDQKVALAELIAAASRDQDASADGETGQQRPDAHAAAVAAAVANGSAAKSRG